MRNTKLELSFALLGFVVLAAGIAIVFATRLQNQRDAAVESLRKRAAARLEDNAATFAPQHELQGNSKGTPNQDAVSAYKDVVDVWVSWYPENRKLWQRYSDLAASDPKEWDAADWTLAAEAVEIHKRMLEQVHQLAQEGVALYPPGSTLADYANPDATPAVEHSLTEVLAELLRLQTLLHAHKDGLGAALPDVITQIQLANAAAQEPSLAAQVKAANIDEVNGRTLRDIIVSGELTIAQATELVQQLQHSQRRAQMAAGMTESIPIFLEWYARLRDEEHPGSWAGVSRRWRHIYDSPVGGFFIDMETVSTAEFVPRLLDAMEMPYYQARPLLENMQEEAAALPSYKPITQGSIQQLSQIPALQAHHEAEIDLMRIGLLTEAYYTQHGVYPETLDFITPYLGSIPLDPFAGVSYRYAPSGDTYVLYSVGHNGEDDGGATDDSRQHAGPSATAQGDDIVWRAGQSAPEKREAKTMARAL